MALFDPGTPCPHCGSPIDLIDDHIGFTFLGSYDANVEILDDGVVHRHCLNQWQHRDAFIEVLNAEAKGSLGERHLLEITAGGNVHCISEKDCHRI